MKGKSSLILWLVLALGPGPFLRAPFLFGEDLAPILEGRKSEGAARAFQYFLMRDLQGNPVRSIRNSPIYEGIRLSDDSRKPWIYVSESLDTLMKNGHIEKAPQPGLESPWAKDVASIEISFQTIENIFSDWNKDPRPFLDFFASSPVLKTQIFQRLLFGSSLSLTHQELKVFKTRAAYPNPEPIRFPIRVPVSAFISAVKLPDTAEKVLDSIWGALTDTYFDIYVSKIDLAFARKTILFNAIDQTLDVEIDLKSAALGGVIHGIGRVKAISDCFDLVDNEDRKRFSLNPNFWSKKGVLVGAEMGPSKVVFSLKFALDDNGFWRIQMAKPLKFRFEDPKPKVTIRMVAPDQVEVDEGRFVYDDKYVERLESRLDEKAIQRIEKTLSEPFESALKNAFFPEDLGLQIPLSGLNGEKNPGLTNMQLRLARLRWHSNGLVVGFDGRLRFFDRPGCAKHLPVSDADWQPDRADEDLPPPDRGIPFVKLESSEELNHQWRFSATGDLKDGLTLRIPKHGLHFFAQSAALSGLYCMSSRSLWPRPAYFPLMEVRPSRLPKVSMEKNQIGADVGAFVTFFERDQKAVRERFAPKSSFDLQMFFSISNDSEKKQLSLERLAALSVEGWTVEATDSFNRLIQSSLKLASSWNVSPNILSAPSLTLDYAGLSHWIKNLNSDLNVGFSPIVKAVNIDSSSLSVAIEIDPKTTIGAKKVVSVSAKKPQTVLQSLPEKFTQREFLLVKYQIDQESPQLYSWRVKSNSDRDWPRWRSFESIDYLLAPFDKPGRYEFQIKSMNRLFEIEEEPLSFEVYYEPDMSVAVKPKLDQPQQKPADSFPVSSEQIRSPKRLRAKGAFGCSLGESESLNGMQSFLIFLFFGFLWQWRRRAKI